MNEDELIIGSSSDGHWLLISNGPGLYILFFLFIVNNNHTVEQELHSWYNKTNSFSWLLNVCSTAAVVFIA